MGVGGGTMDRSKHQMKNELSRFICTVNSPWIEERGSRAVHPDAKVVDSDKYFDWYSCPNCNIEFPVRIGD